MAVSKKLYTFTHLSFFLCNTNSFFLWNCCFQLDAAVSETASVAKSDTDSILALENELQRLNIEDDEDVTSAYLSD